MAPHVERPTRDEEVRLAAVVVEEDQVRRRGEAARREVLGGDPVHRRDAGRPGREGRPEPLEGHGARAPAAAVVAGAGGGGFSPAGRTPPRMSAAMTTPAAMRQATNT